MKKLLNMRTMGKVVLAMTVMALAIK